MKTVSTAIAVLLLGAVWTAPLGAQVTFTGENVNDGSALGETLVIDAEGIGQRTAKRLRLTIDPGAGSSLSLRTVRVRGSQEFSHEFVGSSDLPLLIRRQVQVEVLVFYLPTSGGPATAVLEVVLRSSDSSSSGPTEIVHTVNLIGRTPAYTLNYGLEGGAQVRALRSGGVVDFAYQPVGRRRVATLLVQNTGSGPGRLRGARLTGASQFSLLQPLTLRARLLPGQAEALDLAFTPTTTASYEGTLTLDFGIGTQQFIVAGIGGDLLRYSLTAYRADSVVDRSADIQVGDTVVFGTADESIEVIARNIRQTAQWVGSVAVKGSFRILDSPALPVRLEPGESLGVRVAPTPAGSESRTGELTIDDRTFPLEADVPTLPRVQFSRASGAVGAAEQIPLQLSLASPYPVDLAGVLTLATEKRDFASDDPAIQWETGGRQAAFEIPAGQTAAVFAGDATTNAFQTGTEPVTITVTARFTADIAWAQAAQGAMSGGSAGAQGVDVTPEAEPTVRFDSEGLPALPTVQFSQAGGVVGAAEQIPLQLTLARPYLTDLRGVLTLAFETRAFANDPAIQWATGGRQVAFEIEAGQTEAMFAGDTTTNHFQSGTVTGSIVVTARFFVQLEDSPSAAAGGGGGNAAAGAQAQAVDVTPDDPPEVRFDVQEGAPVLQRVAQGSAGQGRFSVQITGYSTARSVDSFSVSFTGVAGSDLTTSNFDVDVEQVFRTYYTNQQSASFGSQFTVTIEFTLDEGAFEDLASLSVTASNDQGTSNAVSLTLN